MKVTCRCTSNRKILGVYLFNSMGRRAKNKQAPPAPLFDSAKRNAKTSPSKLGKRKEVPEAAPTKPSKKPKAIPDATAGSKGKKKAVAFEDDDEEAGWEDVDDGPTLKKQRRFVCTECMKFS